VLRCTAQRTQEAPTMPDATFTFRVDDDLKSQFTSAAKAHDRTGAQLLRDFMRDFVTRQQEAAADDAWFRRQVRIGIDQADAGQLIPAEDVEVEFTARRAATRKRLAGVKS
jgi:predicted transcriptional regulator